MSCWTPKYWARWPSGTCTTPSVLMTQNLMQSRVARWQQWHLFICRHCGFFYGFGSSESADKGREVGIRDIIDRCRGSRGIHWSWQRIYRRGRGQCPLQSSLHLLWRSSAKSGFCFMGVHVPHPTLSGSHSRRPSCIYSCVFCASTQPPQISVVVLRLQLACEHSYAWFGDNAVGFAAANWMAACAVT